MSAEDNGQGSRDPVSLSDAFQMHSCSCSPRASAPLATQAFPARHLMFPHTVAEACCTPRSSRPHPMGSGRSQCKVSPSFEGRVSVGWPPLYKAPMLILLFAVHSPRRRLLRSFGRVGRTIAVDCLRRRLFLPFRRVGRSTNPPSGGAGTNK